MARPWRAEGVEITADSNVADVAPALLRAKLAELRHHASHAVGRTDPEDLHDLRVATRRLRAALLLVGGPVGELAGQVRRLGHALGRLRDHDVLIEWGEDVLGRARADEAPGLRRIIAGWRAGLPALETLLREALVAFEAHVDNAVELRLGESGWDGPVGGGRIRRHVAGRWERMGRRIDEVLAIGQRDAAVLHALRIDAKKVRYDLELLDEVFVPLAGQALDLLRPLQSLLGDIHDADVHAAILPELIVEVAPEEQAGAVRLLAEAIGARRRLDPDLAAALAEWQARGLARDLGQRFVDWRPAEAPPGP